MADVTAESPDVSTLTLQTNGEYSPSPSPSSAESNFRELDDAFLQTQTRIWLGEVLQIRFDEEMNISDLLEDGELLLEVSEVLSQMLPTPSAEAPHLRGNERKSHVSRKSTKRYMSYYNVGSFLRMCKSLGLDGIDLFSPSDVVEKRDTRKVCMCIRSLSKKVRSRDRNVPDFDSVTCTLAMPTDMVEGIRKSLELSQFSPSLSVGHESEKFSRIRCWKRMSNSEAAVSNGYSSDNCDDADSSFRVAESNGAPDYACHTASPKTPGSEVIRDCSSSLELRLKMEHLEDEDIVECEYLSPTIPDSVGSICSQYYRDQELDNITASTCLASCISEINCKGMYGCHNSDANHIPIDWGCISSDDGYRDCDAYDGEIGLLSHDEDGSDTTSCDSCSLTRENKTCNERNKKFSPEGEFEKPSCTPMKLIRCGNSLSVRGRDLDVHDECAVQDCCNGETLPSKCENLDNKQVDIAIHEMVTCQLSPDIDQLYSSKWVNGNGLPNELIQTNHVSSPTEVPDCPLSYDGNCASQVSTGTMNVGDALCNTTSEDVAGEMSPLLVDPDMQSSNSPCHVAVTSNGDGDNWIHQKPVAQSQASILLLPDRDSRETTYSADIYHSRINNDIEAFDVNTFSSDHTEGCKGKDFMVGNASNPLHMPDMNMNSSPYRVTTNNIKYSELDRVDTRGKSEDHIILAGGIYGKPVNAEHTSMNSFTTTFHYPCPETERPDNVEDTGLEHHSHAENIENKSEDNGTDKEMPPSKPQRTLLKSLVKGTALVGVGVILLHLRKIRRAHMFEVKKQPIEAQKRSMLKPSTRKDEKGSNSSSVYPAQKLHLGT